MRRERGFTLIELLVVMAIIALLLSLLLPALAKARQAARQVKDATQIKQIHAGWLSYAAGAEGGRFPTPGLINRLPVPSIGQKVVGRGPEDLTQNTTANLHSAMIAQNFYSPTLVVSPSEVNSRVVALTSYNYDVYSPADFIFWDCVGTPPNPNNGRFKSDLADLSHTSYANMPILGARKALHWKNTNDSKFIVLGNRGPQDGDIDKTKYKGSRTLEIHGGRKSWEGNMCFNDNHIGFLEACRPEGVDYPDPNDPNVLVPDNLFKADQSGAEQNHTDILLSEISTITVSGNTETHTLTWD